MNMNPDTEDRRMHVGWREWAALPDLGIPAIKVKIDSGARTSALHAFSLETFRERGVLRVRFGIRPLRKRKDIELFCTADVIDRRTVSDSGGHREKRYVIRSDIRVGTLQWPIDITLTNRDTMLFRMLLGRRAMADRLIVDPDESYLTGKQLSRIYRKPPFTQSQPLARP